MTSLCTSHLEYLTVDWRRVDWRLQKALYNDALTLSETKESLPTVFQYPRWRGQRTRIIGRESGHADHFHARFRRSGETSMAQQDQPKKQ